MMNENKLTKRQMCFLSRDGSMLWVDEEKALRIQHDLEEKTIHGHFRVEGRTLNTVEITGVYFPEDIEDMTRRKNGQWKCLAGEWHERNMRCECIKKEDKILIEEKEKIIKECGKCIGGFVRTGDGVAKCECLKKLEKKLSPPRKN